MQRLFKIQSAAILSVFPYPSSCLLFCLTFFSKAFLLKTQTKRKSISLLVLLLPVGRKFSSQPCHQLSAFIFIYSHNFCCSKLHQLGCSNTSTTGAARWKRGRSIRAVQLICDLFCVGVKLSWHAHRFGHEKACGIRKEKRWGSFYTLFLSSGSLHRLDVKRLVKASNVRGDEPIWSTQYPEKCEHRSEKSKRCKQASKQVSQIHTFLLLFLL